MIQQLTISASFFEGKAAIADLLIKKGANIESKDDEGNTPLIIAAFNGNIHCAMSHNQIDYQMYFAWYR